MRRRAAAVGAWRSAARRRPAGRPGGRAGAGRQRPRRRRGPPLRLARRQGRPHRRLAGRLGPRAHQSDAYPLPAGVRHGRSRESAHAGRGGGPRRGRRRLGACCRRPRGAIFTDGQTLRTVLDPATFALVRDQGGGHRAAAGAGRPDEAVAGADALVVPELPRAGFDPALGLDRHFYDRAKAAGRPVRGLETAAYQVERLERPADAGAGRDAEGHARRRRDPGRRRSTTIVTAWRSGDVATLERLLLQSFRESPEIYQRLLVDRNRDWVPQIAPCAAEPRAVPRRGRRRAPASAPTASWRCSRQAGFSVEQQ